MCEWVDPYTKSNPLANKLTGDADNLVIHRTKYFSAAQGSARWICTMCLVICTMDLHNRSACFMSMCNSLRYDRPIPCFLSLFSRYIFQPGMKLFILLPFLCFLATLYLWPSSFLSWVPVSFNWKVYMMRGLLCPLIMWSLEIPRFRLKAWCSYTD